MGVSVTYNLTGSGWAECIIEVGEQQVHLTASYLSDALYSLLDAVIGLMLGRGNATASFAEEPGEYRWRLQCIDLESVNVRILWFNTLWKNRPDEEGEVLFDAKCRLHTFAGAVLAASQGVLGEHGLTGYKRVWGNHEFPLELQHKLKHLLSDEVKPLSPTE